MYINERFAIAGREVDKRVAPMNYVVQLHSLHSIQGHSGTSSDPPPTNCYNFFPGSTWTGLRPESPTDPSSDVWPQRHGVNVLKLDLATSVISRSKSTSSFVYSMSALLFL